MSQSKHKLIKEIEAYQRSENERFKDPATSPLKSTDIVNFESLDFYPINLDYRVEAKFVRTPDEEPFLLRTNTDRLPEYVKYGEIYFILDGKELMLNLYQSTENKKNSGENAYLFLPFTDLTSGDGSYGGGRYLEPRIPEGEIMIIDFNRAFNPYCVYNDRYSCPIVPRENDLFVRIEAGVKDYKKY
jgi:uncharacterized protein (DUF1684 family)